MGDKVAFNMSVWNDTLASTIDIDDYVMKSLGPKRVALNWLVPLTAVYSLIFISGIVGNICTCVVIGRNQYMQTATNCYLFNLAIADMMTLFFVEKDGQYWYCNVNRDPGSSSDLLRLQDQLDRELERQEAREMGICPVRNRLYDQLFEELVRQELVSCPERGRLLRMVQLECRLSLSTAISCYESAVAYGLKRSLSSSQSQMTSEMSQLLFQVATLEDEVRKLEPKVTQVKVETEKNEADHQRQWDEEEEKVNSENELMLKEMLDFIDIRIVTEE